ncbi:hypothetical protein [Rhodobacter lacus]|uniref:Uncharacterized protein n=1 Tax=Rhodobacter lacus TaxID=1641972 RepID=A0ABW5ABT0_9RHOB
MSDEITTNVLPQVTSADEVLVYSDGAAARQPFADFGAQLVASGLVASDVAVTIEDFGGGVDKSETENRDAVQAFLESDVSVLLFTSMADTEYLLSPVDTTGYNRKAFVGRFEGSRMGPVIRNPGYGDSFYGSGENITLQNLYVQGNGDGSNNVSRGVNLTGKWASVRNSWFRFFNDEGVYLRSGAATVADCTGWDCCKNRSSTTRRGALRLGGFDIYSVNNQFGCSQNVEDYRQLTGPDMVNVGVMIDGANCFVVNTSGENADIGIWLTGDNGFNRLINCRGDFSWGHNWLIESHNNMIANGLAENPSLESDGLYDAFRITGAGNRLSNCHVHAVDPFETGVCLPKYAFNDMVASEKLEELTKYSNCDGVYKDALFVSSGGGYSGSSFEVKSHPLRTDSTTPDVNRTGFVVCTQAEGGQITGLVGGYSGQEVTILATTPITLVHSTEFWLRGERDHSMEANTLTSFVNYYGRWYEHGDQGDTKIVDFWWAGQTLLNGASVTSADISLRCNVGDFVEVAPSVAVGAVIYTAQVVAERKVRITVANMSGATVTIPAAVWRVRIKER